MWHLIIIGNTPLRTSLLKIFILMQYLTSEYLVVFIVTVHELIEPPSY